MTEMQRRIAISERPVYNFQPAYSVAAGKANGWRHPLGSATGVGHFLLLRKDLDFVSSLPSVSVEWETSVERFAFPRVFFHSAVRVTWGGAADDAAAMYLVKLVDVRFHLNRWSKTTESFNVRNFAGGDPFRYWIYETTNGGSPWSLLQIARKLWSDCGLLGAFPGAAAFGAVSKVFPEDLFFQGMNAWCALNSLLEQYGLATKYDPIKDKFSVVRLSRDSDPKDRQVASSLLFDSRPFSGAACMAPEKIAVHFHKRFEDYGTEADTAAANNHITSNSFYVHELKTEIAGALPGTVLPLWASTPAVVKHRTMDAILNLQAIKAEAKELARGWISENAADRLSRAQVVLVGWHSRWQPDETIKVVSWRDFGSQRGGCVTEVVKFPGLPIDDLDGAGEPTLAPAVNFEGNDFARKTAPNYPRLPNLVQVTMPNAAAGEQVSPTKLGVFLGKVRRVNAGELASLEPCWIMFVDEYDSKMGNVPAKNGEIYGPARLSGLFTVDDLRLPLYVVRKGDEGPIQFRLKEDLATGKKADAVRIVLNAKGEYEEKERIRVVDWYSTPRGMWQAPWSLAGRTKKEFAVEGWAISRGTKSESSADSQKQLAEYDILWMETLAWTVEFELLEAPQFTGSKWKAKAKVLAAFEQGKHPAVKVKKEEYITVRDDNGVFRYAVKGAKGTAVRSEHEGEQSYYKVAHCQQHCYLAICTALNDACGVDVAIVKDSFKVASLPPHDLKPAKVPTSIVNPRAHSVKAGDEFVAFFNASTGGDSGAQAGQWEVLDTKLYPVELVLDNRVSGTCFQSKYQTFYLEYSCAVAAWRNWHCGTDCDGVGQPGGSGSGG